jgi:Ca2+-binding EF-hand superfamily protein
MTSAFSQSGVTMEFASVDSNHDAMVTREELFQFAERDSIATSSQIELTVEQDGRTLFSIVDENHDRRISHREIATAAAAMPRLDKNGDGQLADSELGTTYRLRIGLGRSNIRRTVTSGTMTSGMQRNMVDAILPDSEQLDGPEWFRRMDRNRDSDVSWREFLGTAAHFARIDSDRDGLISISESQSVELPIPRQEKTP